MPAGRLNVVALRWHGRFGCFVRAEAAKAGYGYPLPPRTAILGLVAAILGLEKDALADELAGSHVAIAGPIPNAHWHKGNYRKDPPAPVDWRVSASAKGSSKNERNTQISMEWMLNPTFEVRIAVPSRWHDELAGRVRDHRHHFTPTLGLAGLLAQVDPLGDGEEELVCVGTEPVAAESVVRSDACDLDVQRILDQRLQVVSVQMPREVDSTRCFSQGRYHVERLGRAIPLRRLTDGWRRPSGEVVAFL